MKERPILMSAPMVRAILAGNKSQTRRIVKPQPTYETISNGVTWYRWCGTGMTDAGGIQKCLPPKCPYGQHGDRLWVREAWRADRCYDHLPPRDIPESAPIFYDGPDMTHGYHKRRPGMFMLRRMSRITLEVTGVRVERLQSITGDDARAEGAAYYVGGHGTVSESELNIEPGYWDGIDGYISGFEMLWQEINAKRAPWATNPWVWVISFNMDLAGRPLKPGR